jgi:hypothetical protein
MIYYIIMYVISILALGVVLFKISKYGVSRAIYYSLNIVLLVPSSYYIASNFFSIKANYVLLTLSTITLVSLGLFASALLSKQILIHITKS